MRGLPWLLLWMLPCLAGCQGPLLRAQRIAEQAGLEEALLPGAGFQHRAFLRLTEDSTLLTVFIEGDGSPWVEHGQRPAVDPSPHNPLALKLAAKTPGSVLYLGRPCYFGLQHEPECSDIYWTSARYSARVVASLAAATNEFAQHHGIRRILIVGYSGGGSLAVLMAPQVPAAAAIVTIAANLDTDAWTQYHGYLPLYDSLNPATRAPAAQPLIEWDLSGLRDTNVPYSSVRSYFDRVPSARNLRYPEFDHVCCWVRLWPEVYGDIRRQLLLHPSPPGGEGAAREPSYERR